MMMTYVMRKAAMVMCLGLVMSSPVWAELDPDIISSVSRVNGVNTTPAVVVKGGLTTGALPYFDRAATAAVFTDVGYFGGMDYIQTSGEDKNDADVQYQVTVNKAGTLYLMIDNRVGDGVNTDPPTLTTVMTWVTTMGFTSTGVTIDLGTGTNTPATIYSLPITAAGTITLQAQYDGTSRTMYVIAAAPATWNLTNKAPVIAGVPAAVSQRTDTLEIDSTITDDGVPATPGLSILWETVSKPVGATVTITPSATVEDPNITVSALGVYTFQVTATDGEKAITKTIQFTYTEAFALQATDRGIASNDSQHDADTAYSTSVMHVRNYYKAGPPVDTRRKVSYLKYNIADIKTPGSGKVFANSYLTMNFKSRSTNRPFYVYGIKEDLDNVTLTGITWNTAPGVKNTPAPDKGTEVTIDTLDKPDLSPLLLAYSTSAAANTWVSTPSSVALDDLLNSDTDGIITLMFISYYPQNTDFEIYNYSENRVEPATGLKGIILRGNMTTPIWAHNPNPANSSTASASLSQLSWTNPEPNEPGGSITCDVYFREMSGDPNDDPNYAEPDYGNYYTALGLAIDSNSISLPAGTIEQFKSYRWIVDIHDTTRDEVFRGYLWTFDTNNAVPEVKAGDDQYVWLGKTGDPNNVTVDLDGTTSDDGLPSPPGAYTKKWTQIGTTPAIVTISPDNEDDTTVVLPVKGTYVFRLTANDGDLENYKDVQIVVAATACEAAKAVPGYTPYPGDINNDCYVSLVDFVLMAQDWLKCSSLASCN